MQTATARGSDVSDCSHLLYEYSTSTGVRAFIHTLKEESSFWICEIDASPVILCRQGRASKQLALTLEAEGTTNLALSKVQKKLHFPVSKLAWKPGNRQRPRPVS